MRGIRLPAPLRQRLPLDALLVVLLTLAGPFGTFVDLAVPLRFLYWLLAIFGCSAIVHVVFELAERVPGMENWPQPPRVALGAALAGIPGAGLVGLLEWLLRDNRHAVDHYLWFWFCVSTIALVVVAAQRAMYGANRTAVPQAPQPAGVAFLRRLPPELGRDLISLSMQDHYVRATTSRGSVMLLIRFADAMRELEGYPGAQVHRSHWIAAGKAKRLLRRKGRVFVELVDGRELPVSRPYLTDGRALVATIDLGSPGAESGGLTAGWASLRPRDPHSTR